MTDCPHCGFPMAWSETHERLWCSVYGDHPARKPSRLLVLADAEICEQTWGKTRPHGRAA